MCDHTSLDDWIKGYHIILAHPALAGVAYFILGSLKFSRAEGFVSSFVSLACRMFLAPSLLSHLFFHLLFHLQNVSHMMASLPPPWMEVLVKDLCNPDVVAAITKER